MTVLASPPAKVGRRLPPWLGRVGSSGVPEAVLGLSAFVYNEVFPDEARTPLSASFEFALCLFTAVCGRWPRIGTFGAVFSLLGLALMNANYLSITVFAMWIPIVSNGAHGRTFLRDVSAMAFLTLMLVQTIPFNKTGVENIQTVVILFLFSGVPWVTGRTINRLREEGRRQATRRTEALRSQRRSIARDLHDTVSYATTAMIMRAEQIKLRTTDDPALVEDLDFIITTGRRSVRDLRGMMETLRRNDPELDLEQDAPWRLVTVEDVIVERRGELAAQGVRLDVRADPDLDSLPISIREALAKLVVEATSNMVKHAGRGPCQLIIEVGEESVEAVFTNPLRLGSEQARGAHGLGIVGALERIEALGGELEATAASGTWILRAQLPLGG